MQLGANWVIVRWAEQARFLHRCLISPIANLTTSCLCGAYSHTDTRSRLCTLVRNRACNACAQQERLQSSGAEGLGCAEQRELGVMTWTTWIVPSPYSQLWARAAGEHERHVQRDHHAAGAGAGRRAHRDHHRLLPPHAPVHPDRAAQDGHQRHRDRPGRPGRAGASVRPQSSLLAL